MLKETHLSTKIAKLSLAMKGMKLMLLGVMAFAIIFVGGCNIFKNSEDTSKPKEYIPGISNQQVKSTLAAGRESIITTRAVSKQAQAVKSQVLTSRMITSRMITTRAPNVRIGVKEEGYYGEPPEEEGYYGEPPEGEFCYCGEVVLQVPPAEKQFSGEPVEDSPICVYTNSTSNQFESYKQYSEYVRKVTGVFSDTATALYSYIGVCKDIPAQICSQSGELIYSWKCDFELEEYSKTENGNFFSCIIETDYFGKTVGIGIGFPIPDSDESPPSSVDTYIVYSDRVSKFSCSTSVQRCDIYLSKCSLDSPCSEEGYNKMKTSCSYTKVGSCEGLKCVEVLSETLGESFAFAEVYAESYCSSWDGENNITIEKDGGEYIYTSSTSSGVKILTCGSKSEVDFSTCSMKSCDKIDEEVYKLTSYEESATAIRYKIESETSKLYIEIDKVAGKTRFWGKIKNDVEVEVKGTISPDGAVVVGFSSKEFSGTISISAKGEVSGSITVQGKKLSLSVTPDDKLKICDEGGNCYIEEES